MRESLFNTITSTEKLSEAWILVKTKNTAGGVDDISISEFSKDAEQHLSNLEAKLKDGIWSPLPYLNISIPKKDGDSRTIGLMAVEDKIVQTSIKIGIEPFLEPLFYSCCYAYRPGKGHQKCIKRSLHEFKSHPDGYYIKGDIDNFFGSINKELLMSRLKGLQFEKELLKLISVCISMGGVDSGYKWTDSPLGLPQGAILSPLLANFYMAPFDQSISSQTQSYVRYSDDLMAWADSEKEAKAISDKMVVFLDTRLGLKLNEPPEIQSCNVSTEFLGIMLSANGASLSDKKTKELEETIYKLTMTDGKPSALYWKGIDGIRRYYLSVLPSSYRQSFSEIMNAVVKKWEAEGKCPEASTIKEITIRLLGINNNSSRCPQIRNHAKKDITAEEIIRARKLEYQKLEAENSELLVSGPGYFVGAGEHGITLRKKGQPIKMKNAAIKHITIMSKGVGFSSNLIGYCADKGIVVDFIGEHATLLASCLPPAFLQTSLWKEQASMTEDAKIRLAKTLITCKMKNQLNLCKYYNKYHKHNISVDSFETTCNKIGSIIEEIGSCDSSGDYRKKYMAYEGQGADLYWNYVRELLSDDNVEFYSRVKQGATDIFNCMLNYGYGILYPRILQALLKQGLNPYLGFVHHADGNQNLVFDFIEIFRAQAVDRVVISMLQKSEKCSVTKDGCLDDDTKNNLSVKIMKRLYTYEKYRKESRRFIDIIDIQAKDLASAISKGTAYRPYLAKW